MSSSTSGLSNTAETGVFWDLDDCPIPDDQTPASVCANIKSALKTAGYVGRVSIVAYSLTKQTSVDFESAQIKLEQPGNSRSKCRAIFQDILIWRMDHRYYSTNLMVISKDLSDNPHYFTTLLTFRENGNNILLAQPEGKGNLRFLASSVWLWSILSTGGSPLNIIGGCVEATPSSFSPSSLSPAIKTPVKQKQKKKSNKKRKIRASIHSED
ncbi:unnamed protein product [Arabidopsis lyrata]|nr:unnamed protein product [Arabidopsis lyrata]